MVHGATTSTVPASSATGIANAARDSREALDPFPILVPIELDPVVAVVFDRDCFVVDAGTIDDNSSILRHPIEQVCEMRQIRKIRVLIDHENCEVERLDVA